MPPKSAPPKGKMPAIGLLISSGPEKGAGGETGEEELGGSTDPAELAVKSFYRAMSKKDARAGAAALRHFIELTKDSEDEDAEY